MDSVGEGEGGKIWENGIETCEMSCMKRDASPGSKKKKINFSVEYSPVPNFKYNVKSIIYFIYF